MPGCGKQTFLYAVGESKLTHSFLKVIWQYRFLKIKSSNGEQLLIQQTSLLENYPKEIIEQIHKSEIT